MSSSSRSGFSRCRRITSPKESRSGTRGGERQGRVLVELLQPAPAERAGVVYVSGVRRQQAEQDVAQGGFAAAAGAAQGDPFARRRW